MKKKFSMNFTLRPEVQHKFSKSFVVFHASILILWALYYGIRMYGRKRRQSWGFKSKVLFSSNVHSTRKQEAVVTLLRKGEELEPDPGNPGFFRRPGQRISFLIRTPRTHLEEVVETFPRFTVRASAPAGSPSDSKSHSNGHSTPMQPSSRASGANSASK